jgi:hypothetical protein
MHSRIFFSLASSEAPRKLNTTRVEIQGHGVSFTSVKRRALRSHVIHHLSQRVYVELLNQTIPFVTYKNCVVIVALRHFTIFLFGLNCT